MAKIYLRPKIDMAVTNHQGILKGELLTMFDYNRRFLLKKSDLKYFDLVEVSNKNTYINFGMRKPIYPERVKTFTDEEKENYYERNSYEFCKVQREYCEED